MNLNFSFLYKSFLNFFFHLKTSLDLNDSQDTSVAIDAQVKVRLIIFLKRFNQYVYSLENYNFSKLHSQK